MGEIVVVGEGGIHNGARVVAEVQRARPLPGGFREGVEGLILPAEHSRLRIVVAKDEWKALNRAIAKCLGPHRMRFALLCDVEGCPDPNISRVKELDGSMLLRCGHADRVFASWV